MSNSPSPDKAETQKVDSAVPLQDLSKSAISIKSPERRLFILSANDKVALRTQMHNIGTSQELWHRKYLLDLCSRDT